MGTSRIQLDPQEDLIIERELDDNELLYRQAIEQENKLMDLDARQGWNILMTHVQSGLYGEGLKSFFEGENRLPRDFDDLREWLEN